MPKRRTYPPHILWWERRDEERGRKGKKPRRPVLPGPRPEPPEDLPAPPAPLPDLPTPGGPGSVPPIELLPKGPFDVHEPLEWDQHRYPPIQAPSEHVYEVFKREQDHIDKLNRWLRRREKKKRRELPKPNRPALPGRDRKRLPAPAPPQLPAGGYQLEATRMIQEAEATGLISPSPLELLDQYLEESGIRYFKAKELTTHRWRHTRQVAPDRKGQPSSAWSAFYEAFPPERVPKGVHFLLARCVVPHPDLWPSILPALMVVDRFRHWLGEPVTGISAYRLPWYNAQIDGSKHSYHMAFAAFDFTYGTRLPGGHLDSGLFVSFVEALYPERGDGIGRYGKSKGNFIHYDRHMNRHEDSRKGEQWWRPRELKGVMP